MPTELAAFESAMRDTAGVVDRQATTYAASEIAKVPLPAAPTTEQLVFAAIHHVCHGPYASAQQRGRLLHPLVNEHIGHHGTMAQAELVLRATFRALVAELPPQALDRIAAAVAAERSKWGGWPPRLRELDGGNHWRPE